MPESEYKCDGDQFRDELRRQHYQDLHATRSKKRNELHELDRQRYSVSDLFRRYAGTHEVPFSIHVGPRVDHDLHKRTLAYACGKHACTALGVLTFAALSVASLELPIPTMVLFLISAIVGYLLSLVVNAGIALATRAGPANPQAERSLRRLALVSGTGMLSSAAAFMLLRFMSAAAQAFVSIVLVAFEASVFTLGGALAAAYLVCSWSDHLAAEYDDLNHRRHALLRELQLIDAELPPERTPAPNQQPQPQPEVTHEDHHHLFVPAAPDATGTQRRTRDGTNGLDRS